MRLSDEGSAMETDLTPDQRKYPAFSARHGNLLSSINDIRPVESRGRSSGAGINRL
jgi:hypothetical protein